MKKKLNIAIDGPAGAGKSTVAKMIASRLGLLYVDTGSMYRALTLKAINLNIGFSEKELVRLCENLDIELVYEDGECRVLLDGQDVTEEIRTPKVSQNVSFVASIPQVRENMVMRQQLMAKNGGVVMDGRDIGTRVMKNADFKFFLTASIEERAKRRLIDLKEKGYDVSLSDVIAEISERDDIDKKRSVDPLVPAEDAIIIDTTDLTAEQVVDKMLSYIKI
ncbi:(d)CMP kinase [Peptococcaceae bacterium]|nr:(d)CMP kinase [Peptococcaceae bacterium]MCL0041722.1 (d)CMP kinase [Peptococcaceae bacterium]MCL0063195.1 (d)CMP kinase [Peptococcaceae bacterium]MCL0071698.1 (d)CMP kinase [Peptococcaceae bacterium]